MPEADFSLLSHGSPFLAAVYIRCKLNVKIYYFPSPYELYHCVFIVKRVDKMLP